MIFLLCMNFMTIIIVHEKKALPRPKSESCFRLTGLVPDFPSLRPDAGASIIGLRAESLGGTAAAGGGQLDVGSVPVKESKSTFNLQSLFPWRWASTKRKTNIHSYAFLHSTSIQTYIAAHACKIVYHSSSRGTFILGTVAVQSLSHTINTYKASCSQFYIEKRCSEVVAGGKCTLNRSCFVSRTNERTHACYSAQRLCFTSRRNAASARLAETYVLFLDLGSFFQFYCMES